MGACFFTEEVIAESAREGFRILKDEAIMMHGHDSYNGTISTCDSFRLVKEFKTIKESKSASGKKLIRIIKAEAVDDCPKRACWVIDCGVVEYIRISMAKETKPADAQYKVMYVLEADGKEIKTASKKSDFDKIIPEYVAKGITVRIVKKPIKIKGNEVASVIKAKEQSFKSRPKAVKGTLAIKELHKYIFVGWAAS